MEAKRPVLADRERGIFSLGGNLDGDRGRKGGR